MSSHLDPAVAELHQVPGGRGPPELEVKELSVEKRRQTDFERDGSPASVVGHDGHFNALKRKRDAWNSGPVVVPVVKHTPLDQEVVGSRTSQLRQNFQASQAVNGANDVMPLHF